MENKKEKNFFEKLLGSGSEISSKRFIVLIAFALLAINFSVNLFTDYKVDEKIQESMETIVEVGMVVVVSEKFSRNKSKPEDQG